MSTTSDPKDPRLTRGVDSKPTEQAAAYLVSDGPGEFVRPVRRAYRHARGRACGVVTRMAQAIAETYARTPSFYGSTYCVGCSMHLPVAEFDWEPGDTEHTVPADQLAVGS